MKKQQGKEYRQLLSELAKRVHASWSDLIPKMYKALRKDGYDAVEAKEQLMMDLLDVEEPLCGANTVYKWIPNEAKPHHELATHATMSRWHSSGGNRTDESMHNVDASSLPPSVATIARALEENPEITRAVLKSSPEVRAQIRQHMIQPVVTANRQAREDKIEVGEPDYALEAYDTIYMSVLHVLSHLRISTDSFQLRQKMWSNIFKNITADQSRQLYDKLTELQKELSWIIDGLERERVQRSKDLR